MGIMETILKWLSKNKIRAIILLILFGLSCMFYYGLESKPLGASMMFANGFLLLMVEQENKNKK